MTRSMKVITGAAIGGIFGHLYMTYFIGTLPSDYVPKTQAGVITSIIGEALPWALIGAGVGYLWGRRKKA